MLSKVGLPGLEGENGDVAMSLSSRYKGLGIQLGIITDKVDKGPWFFLHRQ